METQAYRHWGRMNDPDCSASVRSVCGDVLDFSIIISDGVVGNVMFHTDGCEHTALCGETVARLAIGKPVDACLRISPAMVREQVPGLPEDHLHCAVLAAVGLLQALGEYLFRRSR